MSQELVIHFDNAREAEDILGRHNAHLEDIAQAFRARLSARDGWLRVESDARAQSRLEHFVSILRHARSLGTRIHSHGVLFALKAFQEGREAELEKLYENRIDVAGGKPPVFPRTFGQHRYLQAIRACDLCLGIGPAGTGKTYLAMAMAVHALLRGEVARLILTRPAVEAGETLGFLPGDLQQKVMPYLRPLYDALYDMMPAADIEHYASHGVIEVAPLAYMRGRTLNHAFVILDESQNTTPEQMFMFLTRLGFDSKCVITGDPTQIDLPPRKESGLLEAQRTLEGIDGIAVCCLDDGDVVRHELVQKIIQAYRTGRAAGAPNEVA